MIDFVFPKNNEQEFIRLAEHLKFEALCFVYDSIVNIHEFQQSTKLKIFSGVICSADKCSRFRGKTDFVLVKSSDSASDRRVFEQGAADILFALESSSTRDFIHHRGSGLNHVSAKLAQQKGVAIGFSFSSILSANSDRRALLLGRISQNIRLARKYKFKTVIASFSSDPWHMRSPRLLHSLFTTLGMHPKEAKDSLTLTIFKKQDEEKT